ncbi:MAG: tripartite tricarboxylate transporter TctB family protein [Acetobacteraceae bacterium]|nr:tripartite tricarboxylate transporter TctB family protein [Acetobacteraceae bacterium]
MVRIRNSQDLAAGLFLILVAVLALVFSNNLPTGKLLNMGAGYVPRTLAWMLGGLGIIVAARGFTTDAPHDGPALTDWAWRPLLALTASILVFAFLLEWVGLAICVLITVAVSGLAAPGIRLTQSLAVGAALATLSVLLFIVGLGLPMHVWPEFGGR